MTREEEDFFRNVATTSTRVKHSTWTLKDRVDHRIRHLLDMLELFSDLSERVSRLHITNMDYYVLEIQGSIFKGV